MKQYPKYKESGIQWIGQVPEHWGKCRFKMLHSGTNVGESIDKKYWTENENDTVFYTAGAKPIRTDFRNFPKEKYTTENDLLLARNGTPYVYLPTIHAAYTDHIIRVSILGSVCKVYVSYALSVSITHESVDSVSLATWSASIWNAQELPLPPLSEQEAIAAYLDKQTGKIDKSIESLEQQKSDLQQYRTSLISEAVTHGLTPNTTLKDSGVQWIGQIPEEWKVAPLKYYTSQDKYAIKTGPFGSQLKGDELRENGDVRVYNQRNVIDAQFETVQNFVTSNKAEELESFFTRPGDILLTCRGTIGRAAILPDSAIMGILHPCLIAVRLNTDLLDKRYFLHVLSSPLFRTYVSVESNATTIEVIYTETLKSFILPIPPLTEQEAIAAYLDERMGKIDTAIATIDRQIADLRAYRTALITEAVTGKVDVRVSV